MGWGMVDSGLVMVSGYRRLRQPARLIGRDWSDILSVRDQAGGSHSRTQARISRAFRVPAKPRHDGHEKCGLERGEGRGRWRAGVQDARGSPARDAGSPFRGPVSVIPGPGHGSNPNSSSFGDCRIQLGWRLGLIPSAALRSRERTRSGPGVSEFTRKLNFTV
jgi:hypothetical protein